MKFSILTFLLTFIFSQSVTELDAFSTHSIIGSKSRVLTFFYYSTYPRSEAFKPIFDQLAAEHGSLANELLFTRIDCAQFEGICENYDIRHFPELIMFRPHSKEISFLYTDNFSLEKVNNWIYLISPPPSEEELVAHIQNEFKKIEDNSFDKVKQPASHWWIVLMPIFIFVFLTFFFNF